MGERFVWARKADGQKTAGQSGLQRFVGHWVLLLGVRTHCLGHVVDVEAGILWCDEAYDLENVTAYGPEGHSQRLSPPGEMTALFVRQAVSVGIPPWGDSFERPSPINKDGRVTPLRMACVALGIDRRTARRWIREGAPTTVGPRGRHLVSIPELTLWAAHNGKRAVRRGGA